VHEDVNGRIDFSGRGANGGRDALVARSLEGIQTCPVSRQVGRFEDINTDSRAIRIKNQCRVSKAGTPAGIDEHSVDAARKPAAPEPVELMVVGATRCKGPVRRQAMQDRVHAIPIVPPALIVVRRHIASSHCCVR
jgi:hypothetical protein